MKEAIVLPLTPIPCRALTPVDLLGPLNDVEAGSLPIGSAQQVVIATDVMDGRW